MAVPETAGERTAWAAVWAATLAGVAAAMQIGKAAAALPLIRAEMGADLTSLAAYVSAISAVAAAAGFAFGGLAGRIGARRAGLAGLALMAAGSMGGALAPGLGTLLASRVPEALGFALVATAMPALIGRAAAPRDRALALGLWATWLPVGVAAAMAVALLAPAFGWRGLLAACALAPALAGWLLWRVAPPDVAATSPASPIARPSATALKLAAAFAAFSAANLVVVAFLPTVLHDEIGFTPRQGAAAALLANLALVPGNLGAGWLRGRGAGGRALMALGLAGMLACAAVLFAPDAPPALRLGSALAYGAFCGVPPAVIWGSVPLVARRPGRGAAGLGRLLPGRGARADRGAAARRARGGARRLGRGALGDRGRVAAALALVALVPAGLYGAGAATPAGPRRGEEPPMSEPVRFTVTETRSYERDVRLRMPFRFGVITLREAPQAFVRVRVRLADGREGWGQAAEMLMPKWFDKSPGLTEADTIDQLRRSLAIAGDLMRAAPEGTAFGRHAEVLPERRARGAAEGLGDLASAYGPALLDRAALDGVCRLLGVSAFEAVRANAVALDASTTPDLDGFDFAAFLAGLAPSRSIRARHTVGLVDALTEPRWPSPWATAFPRAWRGRSRPTG